MNLTHGGDIAGYKERWGRAPLDFSANINPLGLPPGVRAAVIAALDTAECYPDPLCRELTAALAARHGVPAEAVLCGGGAADLIFRLALAARPARALLPAPTFAEYQQALELTGAELRLCPLREEEEFALTPRFVAQAQGVEMVFVCNPNNPTGQVTDPALLETLLERCARQGAVLVVDECFQEFLPPELLHSMIPRLPQYPNLVVLKAFTKSYAMAGLRLGYVLCSDAALLEKMRAAGQPWAVSTLAQAGGLAALGEREYLGRAQALVRQENSRMKAEFAARGIRVVGSYANYLFFRAPLEGLPRRLEREGILVRCCDNYPGLPPGWCRAAVRPPEENTQLLAALDRLMEDVG